MTIESSENLDRQVERLLRFWYSGDLPESIHIATIKTIAEFTTWHPSHKMQRKVRESLDRLGVGVHRG